MYVDGPKRGRTFGDLRPRLGEAARLTTRSVDFDLQIRRQGIRLAQFKNVLAAAALRMAADGIVRRYIGGLGDGEREGRERPLDLDPRRMMNGSDGTHYRRRLKNLRGNDGKHR
jgi:hypothetical protein